MQNTCINRIGKQRKSSVSRGARKEILQKERKRLLLLGIKPCTTCKYGPYTAYIRFKPYIRRIYTVGQNPCTVIRIRIRTGISIYGYTIIWRSRYAVFLYVRFWPTLRIFGNFQAKDTMYMYAVDVYMALVKSCAVPGFVYL
jgi:hypothetical protein